MSWRAALIAGVVAVLGLAAWLWTPDKPRSELQARYLASPADLVAVGETSGELPKLLSALARLYETTGRDRIKRALQLIEPLAIIIIGSVIGVIVTAIILAITSVNDVPL